MDTFLWSDQYVTGFDNIDDQHQYLVSLLNQFGSYLTENKKIDQEILDDFFEKLSAYAQQHFTDEEALMTEIGIDDRHFLTHHGEHRRFLREVIDIYSRVDSGSAAESLFKFLTYWLAYHILGDDQSMARQMRLIKQGASSQQAYEQTYRHDEGSTGPLLTALNGLFKEVSKQNRMLVDINKTLEGKVKERTEELYQTNKYLEKMALTDQLTGLPNRRHAMAYLDDYWNKSKSEGKVISCVMIDADGFKQINDQYGHDAGDIVLKVLSAELKNSFRNDDFVARLGGDEFLAILYNTPLEGARHISEQVRKTVSQLNVEANDGVWHGSISVGIASSTKDMATFDELLKLSDMAVYKAKSSGKNCVKTYQER